MSDVQQEALSKEAFHRDTIRYFTPFFNEDKMKERIPSYAYLVAELKKLDDSCTEKAFLHAYQKKTLLKSKNAKKLCRDGIPVRYLKGFLMKMFHIEYSSEDYHNKCLFVFKKRKITSFGSFVPLFTNKTIEDSLPIHFLNEKGLSALKEILWLLNFVLPCIEYSPLIIKIASLLLIFLAKEDTYELMRTLLEINLSPVEINKIRWHFRFTYNDNLKICSSMQESFILLSDEATAKKLAVCKQINLSSEALFQDLSSSLFIDYFNFVGVIRFLPFFLYEGTKSIYRMNYALLKNVDSTSLKQLKEPDEKKLIREFKQKVFELRNINKVYQDSCLFKLNRNNNKYTKQEVAQVHMINTLNYYYLPSFDPQSKILTDDDVMALWAILPLEVKTFDGKMIYSSSTDPNVDLASLYEICEKYEAHSVMFFIVETDKGEAFGGIMNHNLIRSEKGQWITPSNAYLFSIKPLVQEYPCLDTETEVLLCEPGAIRFGNGPNGASIAIGHDLKSGWSESQTVFGNVKLINTGQGGFSIKTLEVYLML